MDIKQQIQQIKSKLQVPQQMQQALQKIEMAGKKVMYSQETHGLVMQAMQGDGPWEMKIGKGIADLMSILFQQSNKTMPPQLIVPAAITLCCDAVEFLLDANQIGPDFNLGDALEAAVTQTLEKFGVKPEQIQPMLEKLAKGGMINSAGQVNTAGPAPGMTPQQPPQGV